MGLPGLGRVEGEEWMDMGMVRVEGRMIRWMDDID